MEVVKSQTDETTEEKKDPGLVEFTNQMFHNCRFNPGIVAITQAKGWGSAEKFKITGFMLKITESNELKTFDETVKYMKEAHDEAQKEDLPELRVEFTGTEPDALELLEADSGFSIKKLKLKVKVLPEGIAPSDLMMARWLIEIDEKEGK